MIHSFENRHGGKERIDTAEGWWVKSVDDVQVKVVVVVVREVG